MSILHTARLRVSILLEMLQGLDFTRANQQPAELGLDEREVFIPSRSGGKALRSIFAELGVQPGDRVLDIGCAKGSAMRDLLRFPFAQVDGIELSSDLVEIARRNFTKLGARHVQVFCGDARQFAGYGNYNVFYLYNPFQPPILDAVLQALLAQTPAGEERIVVYNNPLGHDLMLRHGFVVMRKHKDFWGHDVLVYSNHAQGSRLGPPR
jgi:SAM-dependent methyltransferase